MESAPIPVKPPPSRPPRQPTRTLFAGLVLLVFMLVVWFQAPDVRLPTFFQRLLGISNALLAMLVVMFAIREYGKRYNRLPLPVVGRLSVSKVAGFVTFLAVLAWWLSPWAPIPAGPSQPDLWRMLEEGLDAPLLVIVDTDLAAIDRPLPPAAALLSADPEPANGDPYRRAAWAIATGSSDEASKILNGLAAKADDDDLRPRQALAQLDIYTGHFAAASRRYGELLKMQPRREDFLAHGALAAALLGDYETATTRAQQLLDQAHTRGRESPRLVQAVNLLVAVNVLAGDFTKARQIDEETRPARARAERETRWPPWAEPQALADANNAAVLRFLVGPANSPGPWETSIEAAVLGNSADSERPHVVLPFRPFDQSSECMAVAIHNLGMIAMQEGRLQAARRLLDGAIFNDRGGRGQHVESWAALGSPSWPALSSPALAELDRVEGTYADAEREADVVAKEKWWGSEGRPIGESRLAAVSVLARLRADQGQYPIAEELFRGVLRAASHLPPLHPYSGVTQIRLAAVYLDAGRNAEAQTAADAGLAILEAAGLGNSDSAAEARRISGLAALRRNDPKGSQ